MGLIMDVMLTKRSGNPGKGPQNRQPSVSETLIFSSAHHCLTCGVDSADRNLRIRGPGDEAQFFVVDHGQYRREKASQALEIHQEISKRAEPGEGDN